MRATQKKKRGFARAFLRFIGWLSYYWQLQVRVYPPVAAGGASMNAGRAEPRPARNFMLPSRVAAVASKTVPVRRTPVKWRGTAKLGKNVPVRAAHKARLNKLTIVPTTVAVRRLTRKASQTAAIIRLTPALVQHHARTWRQAA